MPGSCKTRILSMGRDFNTVCPPPDPCDRGRLSRTRDTPVAENVPHRVGHAPSRGLRQSCQWKGHLPVVAPRLPAGVCGALDVRQHPRDGTRACASQYYWDDRSRWKPSRSVAGRGRVRAEVPKQALHGGATLWAKGAACLDFKQVRFRLHDNFGTVVVDFPVYRPDKLSVV